jgi:hypothetical protein
VRANKAIVPYPLAVDLDLLSLPDNALIIEVVEIFGYAL